MTSCVKRNLLSKVARVDVTGLSLRWSGTLRHALHAAAVLNLYPTIVPLDFE